MSDDHVIRRKYPAPSASFPIRNILGAELFEIRVLSDWALYDKESYIEVEASNNHITVTSKIDVFWGVDQLWRWRGFMGTSESRTCNIECARGCTSAGEVCAARAHCTSGFGVSEDARTFWLRNSVTAFAGVGFDVYHDQPFATVNWYGVLGIMFDDEYATTFTFPPVIEVSPKNGGAKWEFEKDSGFTWVCNCGSSEE